MVVELYRFGIFESSELHYEGLWDKVKRVRNSVKANYGDDSSQYEMVGGMRLRGVLCPETYLTPN